METKNINTNTDSVIALDTLLAPFDPIPNRWTMSNCSTGRYEVHVSRGTPPAILERMRPEYYVLEINGQRYNHYETLYFDTHGTSAHLVPPQRQAPTASSSEPGGMWKVNLHFFEVKFKTTKGRNDQGPHPNAPRSLP